MGNLNAHSSSNKFYVTGVVNKFDSMSGSALETSGKKARPSTEVGRKRNMAKAATDISSTADMTGESPEPQSNVSQSNKKHRTA